MAAFEIEGWQGEPRIASYSANVALDGSGQAWLPAVLPILMRGTEAVSFADPMDPVGLADAERAQELLTTWYPHLHRIAIDAMACEELVPPRDGVGCFFSGGVDSFSSVLERRAEITHLIFVHGFDIRFDDGALAARALAHARAAAAEIGKPLIEVWTDLRRVSDPWSGWAEHYHGAALASVGLLLSTYVGRVIIPSSYHEDDLFPWGSHPDLDPLWSTSRVVFEHHGTQMHRADKIASIASSPIAMRHLRVCWENRGGKLNCGECEKCVRTMISLRAYGALERCATLPSRVDASLVKGARRPTHGDSAFARENLALLRSRGIVDPDLIRKLRGVVRRERLLRFARAVKARVSGRRMTS